MLMMIAYIRPIVSCEYASAQEIGLGQQLRKVQPRRCGAKTANARGETVRNSGGANKPCGGEQ